MENVTSDQHKLISSFVEIAVGHSMGTAKQFLKATNWNLEDAINLFLIHRSKYQALSYQNSLEQYYNWSNNSQDEEQIPLPSRRDTLYDPFMYCHSSVPVCPERIWDSMTPAGPDSRLSSLYRPPLDLLFRGLFQDAISISSRENLWLLVNLQSETEFASHALNRDLWSNEAVSQAIKSSFILLQVYDDTNEGQKVSSFYKIESVPPVVLLIDPITGQKMRTWSGMIEAHSFVEDLMKYMDAGPNQHIASLTSNKRIKTEKITCSPSNHTVEDMATFCDDVFVESAEGGKTLTSYAKEETCSSSNHTDVAVTPWGYEFDETMYLPEHEEETCLSSDLFEFLVLTEEPKGDCDGSLVCSLCVRFPDGRRKQRKFLKSEPIQLLWSFCYSHMEESERNKAFKLVQAIPGASKTLDYGTNATFEQSGLANAMISVTWE